MIGGIASRATALADPGDESPGLRDDRPVPRATLGASAQSDLTHDAAKWTLGGPTMNIGVNLVA